MSTYKTGDIVNGHIMTEEGWRRLPKPKSRMGLKIAGGATGLLLGVTAIALSGFFVISSAGAGGGSSDPRASDSIGEASNASKDGSIAPYAPGIDQWPDGTRVDFLEGAKQSFSQWHMDEAIANWYPNQGSICETVTVDGPLTLVKDIVDAYEGTARAFGNDAYSIGWATAVLAVGHCPNAYARTT